MDRNRHILDTLCGLFCFAFVSCQTISTYDAEAYKQQTGTLAEIFKLMDKANTPYSQNTDQIESTELTLEKAYEYDFNRPLNKITLEMWNLIRDPKQGSFEGFMTLWKAKGAVSLVYISEKKQQIANQFDRMTGLESGKIH